MTDAVVLELRGQDAQDVLEAARLLAQGGLLAFPTETVYGLGARADDEAAVGAIFRLKGRPPDHPVIVHVLDVEGACAFAAAWPPAAQVLARHFWPGPLTLIVPRRPGVAAACAGGQDSIGVRCPSHPVARALLRQAQMLGVPGVAGPSANRFGRVSPTCAAHVVEEFGPGLAVLDGGACEEGIESTIVDCTGATPRLLRPGTLIRPALEAVLAQVGLGLAGRDAAAPRVSGSLASHYAPRAPVTIVDSAVLRGLRGREPGGPGAAAPDAAAADAGAAAATRVGVYSCTVPPAGAAWRHRAMPSQAAAVAHELFAVLRDFDAQGAEAIWVEAPPATVEWEGVRDRLRRAATR